jgi:hypothetical protein
VNKISPILSLIALAGLCHADMKSEIQANRHKQEQAAMAKDGKAVEAAMRAGMTSDFKYVQGKETQDFKTFMKNFMASMVMMEKVSSSSSRFIEAKQHGNKGTGKVELKMTGTMKNPDKSLHSVDWTGQFTEEYRREGGKWKTAVMTAGSQKFLVDGKPVKM